MSSDVDKLCRAIFYNLLIAKNLQEAIQAVEAIIGPDNAAQVRDLIAQHKEKAEK